MGFGSVFKKVTKAVRSVGDALGGFSPLISGGLSYLGQSSANAWNAAQSAEARKWQEMMRATQYQTAVKDMQAAGLNPMLAYSQGGAGNLSGAVAAPAQNALGQAVSSALQARQLSGQLKQMDAQNENLAEENKQIRANTQESKDRALLARQQAQTEVNRSYREGAEGIRIDQATALDRLESAARVRLLAAQARNFDANSAYTALRNKLDMLDLPGKEADAEYRRTSGGRFGRQVGTGLSDLMGVSKLFGR